MPPEMPVIYENPRFDAATPTLKPVIDRVIRFGAVMMIEWGTLALIEDAPRYLKYATVAIAVLILAVHESWPWLRMRNSRLYPAFMIGLVLAYIGIFTYASISETNSPVIPPATSQHNPTVPAKPVDRRKNPLNDNAAKWGVVSRLHNSLTHSNVTRCPISIMRYQLPYAETFADDLKAILTVLDWPFQEHFASVQEPRGLTVKSSDRNKVSRRCGDEIHSALRNSATWRGGTWNVGKAYFPRDKDCVDCIEIDIGNDPDQ